MDPIMQGVIGLLALFFLIALRVPIAFAMFLVGFGGLALSRGIEQAVSMAGSTGYHGIANWLYLVIPMFILMGEFAGASNIISDLFYCFKVWFGRIRGALAMVTVFTSMIFAFATGSTLAATAVMGKVALPEMTAAGYKDKISLATVLGGGTLGNIIPPSIGLSLYGILTEQSIGKLLIAGIMPGLMVTALLVGLIYFWIFRDKDAAPLTPSSTWAERFGSLKNTVGMILILIFVLGGIYTGVVTITEAATVGAFGALIVGLLMRRLDLAKIHQSLINTMKLSAVIFFLLFSVALFTRFLAFTGFTGQLTKAVTVSGIPPMVTLLLIAIVFMFMGCIMDATSMMLLVVPVTFPIVVALGFNPIWYGVLSVAMVQIGQITPPVGMCVYVLKGVSGMSLEKCFSASWSIVGIWIIAVALLIKWPVIALWLTSTM